MEKSPKTITHPFWFAVFELLMGRVGRYFLFLLFLFIYIFLPLCSGFNSFSGKFWKILGEFWRHLALILLLILFPPVVKDCVGRAPFLLILLFSLFAPVLRYLQYSRRLFGGARCTLGWARILLCQAPVLLGRFILWTQESRPFTSGSTSGPTETQEGRPFTSGSTSGPTETQEG